MRPMQIPRLGREYRILKHRTADAEVRKGRGFGTSCVLVQISAVLRRSLTMRSDRHAALLDQMREGAEVRRFRSIGTAFRRIWFVGL